MDNKNPDSLEEALALALRREQYLAEQEELNPIRRSAHTQPHNAKLETARVYAVTGSRRKLCWICESPDHVRHSFSYLPARF